MNLDKLVQKYNDNFDHDNQNPVTLTRPGTISQHLDVFLLIIPFLLLIILTKASLSPFSTISEIGGKSIIFLTALLPYSVFLASLVYLKSMEKKTERIYKIVLYRVGLRKLGLLSLSIFACLIATYVTLFAEFSEVDVRASISLFFLFCILTVSYAPSITFINPIIFSDALRIICKQEGIPSDVFQGKVASINAITMAINSGSEGEYNTLEKEKSDKVEYSEGDESFWDSV